jgi:uncharacterized membrane protein
VTPFPAWHDGLISPIRRHIVHHFRFYAALLLGAGVFAADAASSGPVRLIAAGDTFFTVYLVQFARFMTEATPDRFRDKASYGDEGVFLIFLITSAAVIISFAAIFTLVNRDLHTSLFELALSVASVPLAWLMFHTVAAFHYAHRYYTKRGGPGGGREDMRGLAFPGTKEPVAWDFLYYAFVIGMTAQVSDVQVYDTRMRRLTLIHGIASFFFNTVIFALAVNVVVNLGH